MITAHKIIASLAGVGYIKGGGTIAAAITCFIWYLLRSHLRAGYGVLLVSTLLVLIVGIWSATMVDDVWGKDSSKVVIDEVAGMCVSMVMMPVNETTVLIAFVIFRLLDIRKPLYIRRTEQFPRGWGVMADDVLAGIYTNAIVHVLLIINLVS